MSQSFEILRNQFDYQLDLTLRIVQTNGAYAEKIVTSHFAMLQGLVQSASIPESYTNKFVWHSLKEEGNVLAGYCKSCLRDGLDYQQEVLVALSRK